MKLTFDEIADLIDCINNRIDDLTWDADVSGDEIETKGEIERMNNLLSKLSKELEEENRGPSAI